MWWRLLILAHALMPSAMTSTRTAKAVSYVFTAACEEGATSDDAALAMTWAVFESALTPTAQSPDGQDAGLMQLRGAARDGHSAAELKSNPVLSVRLWFRWLAVARVACPVSTACALRVLSSGRPDGAGKLVARRMKIAGVSP